MQCLNNNSIDTKLFRTVCEYLLIKDTTLIPNVMWFEYANARQETKNRTRKFIKSQ